MRTTRRVADHFEKLREQQLADFRFRPDKLLQKLRTHQRATDVGNRIEKTAQAPSVKSAKRLPKRGFIFKSSESDGFAVPDNQRVGVNLPAFFS